MILPRYSKRRGRKVNDVRLRGTDRREVSRTFDTQKEARAFEALKCADCLAVMGRRDEAEDLFERLCALSNDVGLLAEQYDPFAGRMLGNFPQALSHVSLINTAQNLSRTIAGPAESRRVD